MVRGNGVGRQELPQTTQWLDKSPQKQWGCCPEADTTGICQDSQLPSILLMKKERSTRGIPAFRKLESKGFLDTSCKWAGWMQLQLYTVIKLHWMFVSGGAKSVLQKHQLMTAERRKRGGRGGKFLRNPYRCQILNSNKPKSSSRP